MTDPHEVREIYHSRMIHNRDLTDLSTDSETSLKDIINVSAINHRLNRPWLPSNRWDTHILQDSMSRINHVSTHDTLIGLPEHFQHRKEAVLCRIEQKFPTIRETKGLIYWGQFDEDDQRSSQSLGGSWGRFALEREPWKSDFRPYVNVKSYSQLELTNLEERGILSDRLIAACSGYLEVTPEKNEYHPLKVELQGKYLCDISVIAEHHYLQYIDLSHNFLTDLSPLSHCPFLMYLDASYNKLDTLLDFQAPWNLTYVNYANNMLTEIPDLKDFWSICYLDLSCNKIKKIEGLLTLRYLKTLILADNYISHLENLNHLRIEDLDLQNNKIATFDNFLDTSLRTLYDLQWVNLANNLLPTLSLFKNVISLKSLTFSNNRVSELLEVNHLRGHTFMTHLDLTGNPLTLAAGYREVCIDSISSLTVLDGICIEIAEKVSASILYSPNIYLSAARNNAKISMLHQLNHPAISLSTIPFDQGPHPLLVIVGPSGSNKGLLVKKFVETYPKRVYRAISHTTRPHRANEDENDYYHVSREVFNKMAREGEFIVIHELLGNSFGFSQNELLKAVEQRAVCILKTGIAPALVLRMQGLRPTLVLGLPRTEKTHFEWITQKYSPVFWDSKNKDAGAILLRGNREDASANNKERFDTGSARSLVGDSDTSICCPCNCTCGGLIHRKTTNDSYASFNDLSFNDLSFNMSFDSSDSTPISSVSSSASFDSSANVAPDLMSDFFTNFLLSARARCLEMHEANPGLFVDTVFTDEPEIAIRKLHAIVKAAIINYPDRSPSHEFPKDEVYANMLHHRINHVADQLAKHRDTAKEQREAVMTSHPDEPMPSEVNPPKKDIIAKYSQLERVGAYSSAQECPAHMLLSTYLAFDT